MATATRDQGKTGFVTEFFRGNPQGNVQAVNEAWTKAGKDGSVGATLIQKLRSEMGLSRQSACNVETQDSRQGEGSR